MKHDHGATTEGGYIGGEEGHAQMGQGRRRWQREGRWRPYWRYSGGYDDGEKRRISRLVAEGRDPGEEVLVRAWVAMAEAARSPVIQQLVPLRGEIVEKLGERSRLCPHDVYQLFNSYYSEDQEGKTTRKLQADMTEEWEEKVLERGVERTQTRTAQLRSHASPDVTVFDTMIPTDNDHMVTDREWVVRQKVKAGVLQLRRRGAHGSKGQV